MLGIIIAIVIAFTAFVAVYGLIDMHRQFKRFDKEIKEFLDR